ncbi:MAG TPA: hypothetical protein ACFYD6_11355 [Candidatus Brocadiia bacterium]|nr:hypothetical protein [Candidatus Brocadiales bacterium]
MSILQSLFDWIVCTKISVRKGLVFSLIILTLFFFVIPVICQENGVGKVAGSEAISNGEGSGGEKTVSQDNITIEELEKQFGNAVKNVQPYPEIPREINLIEQPKVLRRILLPVYRDFLVINDDLVSKHFRSADEAVLANILKKWNLPFLDTEQYISIPFFIEIPASEGTKQGIPRFIISSKIHKSPLSTRLYYLGMLKAYAALPRAFKDAPSCWSHGLSSLIAQDFWYPGSMASCPELEVETAIATLLFHKNNNLIWDAYLEDESSFDYNAYKNSLRNTIKDIGSGDTDKALTELLRSPEEYYAQGQKERTNAETEGKSFVTLIPPNMYILWLILPDSETGLHSIADFSKTNIKHSGLRLVILNACYDKLCARFGQTPNGLLTNSAILLSQYVEDRLRELSPEAENEAKQLINNFDQQREDVWNKFNDELQKRGQKDEDLKKKIIAYDPSMLKWTFTFLYNYSLDIRKKQKELRDQIRSENPGISEEDVDKKTPEKITGELMLQWWRQDPLIAKLLDKVGEPSLDVKRAEPNRGIQLDCVWSLQRQGTSDIEKVTIHIWDPCSSGGGKPKPGVSGKAKVVVRKDLNSAPEEIELKDIKKNYFVQTLGKIDDVDVEKMEEDWARVVAISTENTIAPWQINSGAGQSLEIGRIQAVRVKLGNENTWKWQEPRSIRAKKDVLLGIKPEGPIPEKQKASFFPAEISNSSGVNKNLQLVLIQLSHKEVTELKESGTGIWGYFADSRFVQAEVFPADEGIDGMADIEIPDGKKKVESLQPPVSDKPGEKVNAFDYKNPNTFVDNILKRDSKITNYIIKISYKLPDGGLGSIRVAEGQLLVVYESENKVMSLKKAYQLKNKNLLVCGFLNDGSPKTAEITNLEGLEEKLGVYEIALKQCPLIRVNGILIPVKTKQSRIYPGIEKNSLVQMSPSLEIVREASAEKINLKSSLCKRAFEVNTTNLILSYNVNIDPRSFWQAEIAKRNDYESTRYVQIITDKAKLLCGHFQEVYTTNSDWNGVGPKQASLIVPGEKVVWLSPDGTINLIPVVAVQEMHPTKEIPSLSLCEFTITDTAVARAGIMPNMFANGILVNMRFNAMDAGGEDLGKEGPNRGISPAPKEKGPGYPQPGGSDIVRNEKLPETKIKYNDDDVSQFVRNRQELNAAFARQKSIGAARPDVIQRFLSHYFDGSVSISDVYKSISNYLHDYLYARDFLVNTGNPRVLPGFINSYLFLATLVYEAGDMNAGDALTRDFFCFITRTINKQGGKGFYSGDSFCVRNGILAARDILLYMRNKCEKDGFEPITQVEFSAESFDAILKQDFIGQVKCSEDILNNNNVNLYNLCRQLDKWAGMPMPLAESIVSPELKAHGLFEGTVYRERLRTR